MAGSSGEFDHLLETLGTPPLCTVVRVNTLKTTVNDAQEQLQRSLDQVFCRRVLYLNLLKSLIIHKEKTKEITTMKEVWKS